MTRRALHHAPSATPPRHRPTGPPPAWKMTTSADSSFGVPPEAPAPRARITGAGRDRASEALAAANYAFVAEATRSSRLRP